MPVLHVRDVDCPWTAEGDERVVHRLVLTLAAAEQVDNLPVPERMPEEGETIVHDGRALLVVDQATGKRWYVRRAQCGLGRCSCDLQGWPATRREPVPPAEWFDDWRCYLTPEELDALEAQ